MPLTFAQYQLREAGKDSPPKEKALAASKWEQAIVIAFNGGYDPAHPVEGLTAKTYEKAAPVAEKIAEDIRQTIGFRPKDHLTHIGNGSGTMVGWWQGKPIPKTDCYGGRDVNISLKKKGESQILSAMEGEAVSTFRAAVGYMSKDARYGKELLDVLRPALKDKLRLDDGNVRGIMATIANVNRLERSPELKAAGVTKADLITTKFDQRSGKRETFLSKAKVLKQADKMIQWKKRLLGISSMVSAWFADNPTFKEWFVYEALTGRTKFAPDVHAKANWLVVFDIETGTGNEIHALDASGASIRPSAYVKQLAESVRIGVNSKSGDNRGKTLPAALRGNVRGQQPTMQEMIESAMRACVDDVLMTEANALDRVTAWFKDLFARIMAQLEAAAHEGLDHVLVFLGFDPTDVTVTVGEEG